MLRTRTEVYFYRKGKHEFYNDVCYLEKVVVNVKLFVIKIAKRKQSSILTFIQNTKSNCQKAKENK
jgi:hypothetical protein